MALAASSAHQLRLETHRCCGVVCWAADPLVWAQVRLEHMLQRLRCLQDAAATAAPTQLLPHLYISGAVPAASHHVLRHLGISHVLNATSDLPPPAPSAGFTYAALKWARLRVVCQRRLQRLHRRHTPCSRTGSRPWARPRLAPAGQQLAAG